MLSNVDTKSDRGSCAGYLTHWGRVTHICIGNLTIIGSDNGLSPGRRRAITWTNVGILLIGPLGTNFSEMLIETHTFSFKKIHLKMSSGKWRPSCLGLNVFKCEIVSGAVHPRNMHTVWVMLYLLLLSTTQFSHIPPCENIFPKQGGYLYRGYAVVKS